MADGAVLQTEYFTYVRDPTYGINLKRRTRLLAHDENNLCHVGDTVLLAQSRPHSPRKHHVVRDIVRKDAGVLFLAAHPELYVSPLQLRSARREQMDVRTLTKEQKMERDAKRQQAAAAAAASVSAAGASPAVSSSPTKASPLAPAAAPTPVPTPVSAPVAAAASSPAGRLTEDFNLEAFATVSFPDLRFGKKIGEGQYGVVSKGTYFDTTVAIKQLLEVEGETFEQTLKYIKRELHALMELRHPNIVQFMGYGVQAQTVFIVTEFIDGGDLHLLLKTLSIELPWHLRIAMAADVARAMCFLHALNWVHRDLKTENLLVDRNGKLKICDLGLARKLNPQKPDQAFARPHAMTVCGTNEFMSPEMILGMPYERNTDVFSFGVIMGEVLTRKEPKEREPEIGYQIDWPEIKQLIPPDWYVSECQCQCQCQRQ